MLTALVLMVVVLLLSVVVVAYVAFPHRGEDLPAVPWLGTAMRRGVRALPTLDADDADAPADARERLSLRR